MKLDQLHTLVAAVCPIDGIDSSGTVSFKPEATEEERSAALSVMAQNLPSLTLEPTEKDRIVDQIDLLERQTLMNRVTREALLAMAEAQAAAQGKTPQQLYQLNIGYRKTKDIDTQIAQLRGKL